MKKKRTSHIYYENFEFNEQTNLLCHASERIPSYKGNGGGDTERLNCT
jgi:hypothetical protein